MCEYVKILKVHDLLLLPGLFFSLLSTGSCLSLLCLFVPGDIVSVSAAVNHLCILPPAVSVGTHIQRVAVWVELSSDESHSKLHLISSKSVSFRVKLQTTYVNCYKPWCVKHWDASMTAQCNVKVWFLSQIQFDSFLPVQQMLKWPWDVLSGIPSPYSLQLCMVHSNFPCQLITRPLHHLVNGRRLPT